MNSGTPQSHLTLEEWLSAEIPDYFQNFHAGIYSRQRAVEIAKKSEINGVNRIDCLWQVIEQAAFDYLRQTEMQEQSDSNKSMKSRISKILSGKEEFPDIELEIFPDPDPIRRLFRAVIREIEYEVLNPYSAIRNFGFFPIENQGDGQEIITIPKFTELSMRKDFRSEICGRARQKLTANNFAKPIDLALWNWTLRITDLLCSYLHREFGINNDYKIWSRPMEKFIAACAADLIPKRVSSVHNILSRPEFRKRYGTTT